MKKRRLIRKFCEYHPESEFIKIKALSYDERKKLTIYSKGEIKENGCWEWLGFRDKNGYGKISYEHHHKMVPVHRLMYKLLKGEIPIGLYVCHHCDNPSCFNINHLFLGTPKDNSRDRENKKRGAIKDQSGEKNHMAVLTPEIVLSIRKDSEDGMKQADIVRKYELRQATISKILLRKRWTHI